MTILFFASLSLAALAGLLSLNGVALRAAKARQNSSRTNKAAQEKLRGEEELEQIRAQRDNNTRLHGATAERSNAHEATCEAEIPVPGYVPVWAPNGVMWVIIYVAPDNVDGRAEERRQKALADAHAAEQAAWNASTMGRATKKIGHTLGWIIAAPFILLLTSPLILLFGLPIALFIAAVGFKTLLIIAAIIYLCNSIKADIKEEIQEELRAGTPTAQ